MVIPVKDPGARAAGPPDYDGLARVYRALEFLAFGRDLEAARFCFLDRLRDCGQLLVLGEGDGRCLARTLRRQPQLKVTCVDASAAMLRRAAGRLDPAEQARVRFVQADVRDLRPAAGAFDGVMTCFFLDGFTDAEVAGIVSRVVPALRPAALWLTADFALPERGLGRWRARVWLAVLYAFFRWRTGLRVRRLPEIEAALAAAGFGRVANRELQWGLIRTSVLRRGGR